MKKILFFVLLILYSSEFVFGGDFEDTLKKAEQGDAAAQYNLGVMYDIGGVTLNDKLAYAWFRLVGAQRYNDATDNTKADD